MKLKRKEKKKENKEMRFHRKYWVISTQAVSPKSPRGPAASAFFVAPSARFYCNNMWGKFSFSPFEQFCILYRLFWHDIVVFCGISNGRAKLVTIQFFYSKIVNACWVFCFTHMLLMLFYFPWHFCATLFIFGKTSCDSKKYLWQYPR